MEDEIIGGIHQPTPWFNLDAANLLQNTTYQELDNRHRQRQAGVLSQNLTDEEFFRELHRANGETNEDILNTLPSQEQQREYYYYCKFRQIEDIREDLDPGMYEIASRFNSLPFRTFQSCTGHIDPETGLLLRDFFPALIFDADSETTDQEKEVQSQFISFSGLREINERISLGLGVIPQNFVQLKGYIDNRGIEHSVGEALRKGGELNLFFDIDRRLAREVGAQLVLQKIWEGLWEYFRKFDKKDLPLPDFKGFTERNSEGGRYDTAKPI